jgi:hypothetical protein
MTRRGPSTQGLLFAKAKYIQLGGSKGRYLYHEQKSTKISRTIPLAV